MTRNVARHSVLAAIRRFLWAMLATAMARCSAPQLGAVVGETVPKPGHRALGAVVAVDSFVHSVPC